MREKENHIPGKRMNSKQLNITWKTYYILQSSEQCGEKGQGSREGSYLRGYSPHKKFKKKFFQQWFANLAANQNFLWTLLHIQIAEPNLQTYGIRITLG